EAAARERGRTDAARRLSALSNLVTGTMFMAFAVGCIVLAAVETIGALSDGTSSFADMPAGVLGWPVFAVFWLATGSLMVLRGVRGRRRLANRRYLRATGLRGTGTVLESEGVESGGAEESESSGTVRVLKLRVAVEGRHPYDVRLREVANRAVYPELERPVLVDAADPSNVMVDWHARW
ncbi:MAG: hypothetical protein ABSE49_20870, partial [Polyangiaceae bacterium]